MEMTATATGSGGLSSGQASEQRTRTSQSPAVQSQLQPDNKIRSGYPVLLSALLKVTQIALSISCLCWARNGERIPAWDFFLLVVATCILFSTILLIFVVVSPPSSFLVESSSFKYFLFAEIFYHGIAAFLFAISSVIYLCLIDLVAPGQPITAKERANLENRQLAGIGGLINAVIYAFCGSIAWVHWKRLQAKISGPNNFHSENS